MKKYKKFKLPDVELPEIIDNMSDTKKNNEQDIIISDKLTYDIIKEKHEILFLNTNINSITCKNINDIDITGIQVLLSLKKTNPDIKISMDLSNELKELLKKTDCKF